MAISHPFFLGVEKMIFKKEYIKNGYSVVVELELLKYKDRLRLIKEMNFQVKPDGSIDGNPIDQMERLTESVRKQIKSIKIKTSEKEYTSLDELEYFVEYSEIINELIGIVMNGVKMGEVSGQH